jgi:hypothetical protein
MQAQANTGLGGDVNILEAMEMFKAVPDQVLPKYAQDPKLAIFAAAEMARREDMRKRYSQRAQKPNKPVIAQLAESMAPSMPMMPPGMNAPQEQQPMQMAPSQQEMPQAGLAGLMPEQRMAGGGPVAFQFGGGVGAEFGGDPVVEEEKEVRVPAIINGQRVMATAAQLRAAGYPESTIQQRVKEAAPKPAQPAAQPAQSQQKQQVIAPQQAPAAQAPMGIEAILSQGEMLRKKLGIQPTQVAEPYETAGRAEQIYKERQGRFTDEISPIMDQLKKFYGQQPSQQEIQKAANRQIALAMMGSKDRNFLAGLSGGLQAGEDVKKTMAAENRAMQQASLQAQLAHAKYQDAIRRGDYDAAQKAAREEQAIGLRIQEMRRQDAMLPLELGIAAAKAMPKPAAGEKPIDPLKLSKEMREVYAMPQVQAEIKAIEDKYNRMAETTLGFGGTGIFGSVPKTWREPGQVDAQGRKTESLGDKMRREQDDVLRRYASKFGVPYSPYVVSADEAQRYLQKGQGGR